MSDLSAGARALLEHARAGLGPAPGDKDRLRAAALAPAAGVGAGSSPVSAAPWLKLVILVVVAGGAVGAAVGYRALASGGDGELAAWEIDAPEVAAPAPPEPEPTIAPLAVVAGDEEAASAPPPPPKPRERARPASTLADEIAAIAAARDALDAGGPARALALLRVYHDRFPSGQLAQEAMLVAIRAHCAAGDADRAQGLLRVFETRWPDSPHADAARAACAPDTEGGEP